MKISLITLNPYILGFALCLFAASASASPEKGRVIFTDFGCNGEWNRAEVLHAAGITYLNSHTRRFLIPDQPDEKFAKHLANQEKSPIPVKSCNYFLPGSHRSVGEHADHEKVLAWSDVAFRRLKQVGGDMMIFGSGGSRYLKEGWPVEKADKQFVALLKKLGPLARKHGITVAVEPLNSEECNYLTSLTQVAALIRQVNHPNIRACADIYHMAKDGEGPEVLRAAMDVVDCIEIAEKKDRAYPGVGGQDFKPYFRVLRDAGYQGRINLEASGNDGQVAAAVKELKKQEAAVLAE
jgi:sugar phosphate isomerase/epimerase